MLKQNVILEKSLAFATRVVRLSGYLSQVKKEFVISRQICKSGTSIGANVAEAQRAQSRADFAAKMNIALKEANETLYWLKLLHRTDYLSDKAYKSLEKDLLEILKILIAICNKLPQK